MFDIEFSYKPGTGKVGVYWRTQRAKLHLDQVAGRHGFRCWPKSACFYGKLNKILALRDELKGFKLAVSGLLQEAVAAESIRLARVREEALTRCRTLPLDGRFPYDFQMEDIIKMSQAQAMLNTNPVGLGKSIEGCMVIPSSQSRVIIFCPKSMRGTWATELSKWRPDLKVFVPKEGKHWRLPEPGEAVIATYGFLPMCDKEYQDLPAAGREKHDINSLLESLIKKKLDPTVCLIADEGQMVAKLKAARSTRFRVLCWEVLKNKGNAYVLTASPLKNKPPELWCILMHLKLTDEIFGTWEHFCQVMGGAQGEYGMVWTGQYGTDIGDMLAPAMIAREKREAWKDMPEQVYQEFKVDLTDRKMLKFLNQFAEMLGVDGMDDEEVLKHFERMRGTHPELLEEYASMRKELAMVKYTALIETIESYEDADEPLVVASHHVDPIIDVGSRPGWACIHGGVTGKARDQVIEDFQAGKLKGIGITIQAGGVGITLTRAHHMVFVDQAWVPEDNYQMQGRIHRIGQEHTCFYVIASWDHPLERRLDQILSHKKEMVDTVIGQLKASKYRDVTKADQINQLAATMGIGQKPATPAMQPVKPAIKPDTDRPKPDIRPDKPPVKASPELVKALNSLMAEPVDQAVSAFRAHYEKELLQGLLRNAANANDLYHVADLLWGPGAWDLDLLAVQMLFIHLDLAEATGDWKYVAKLSFPARNKAKELQVQ